LPRRSGARPVFIQTFAIGAISASAVSNMATSRCCPSPVTERRNSAEAIANAAIIAVDRSTMELPTRVGGPSGWPVTAIRPETACTAPS
jgi:hypothetical protein